MLKRYLRIIKSEVVMNMKDTFSYKVGIISTIIITIALYFSCLFMNGYSSIGSFYNTDVETSKSLVLGGYIFWNFTVMILSSTCSNIRSDCTKGTLEQKSMSVVPLQIILFGDLITSFLLDSIVAVTVSLFSVVFLKIKLAFNVMAFITFLITLIGMYGFALIFGGITLISKRIDNLVYIVQLILLIVSNSVMQVEGTSSIGKIFPISLGVEISRKYIIGMPVSLNENLMFILCCAFWMVFGIASFQYFLNKTKYKGILSQY